MMYKDARDPLLENGFVPVPIVPEGKAPAVSKWAEPTFVSPKGFPRHGVGIKTGVTDYPIAGVDLDIVDKDILVEMVKYIKEHYGATITRVGKAPKMMLVYRHATSGTRKKSSKKYSVGQVEILGAGQQFVAYGTHPDTGAPYDWNSAKEIKDVNVSEIPILSEHACADIIDHFEDITSAHGHRPFTDDVKDYDNFIDEYDPDDPLMQSQPIGLPPEKIKELLNNIDADCSRDVWRNIGMALHHENKGDFEGFTLWDEWSALGEKYKGGECERQWDSFGSYRGQPLTAAYLLKIAKAEKREKEAEDYFGKMDGSVLRFSGEPDPIPMVIKDFMPRGIVGMIYSAGGVGKSTLMLHMCCKIALKEKYDCDFLGFEIEGGKTAVVTAEDPDIILHHRIKNIVADLSDELFVSEEEIFEELDKNLKVFSTFGDVVQLFSVTKDSALKTTGYYESLSKCLSAMPDLQVVLIDTKSRYSGAEGLGNVVATQEVTFYEGLTKATNASIILSHHTNKVSRGDSATSGQQAYRDSTGLFDSVRAGWYLRPLSDTEMASQGLGEDVDKRNYLLLENSKNNYIKTHDNLVLFRQGYRYHAASQAKQLKKSELEKVERSKQRMDMFVAAMQEHVSDEISKSSLVRLCSAEGVGGRTVIEGIIDKCVAKNLIVDVSDPENRLRSYALTDTGKKYKLSIE